jgi:hypothetical protein
MFPNVCKAQSFCGHKFRSCIACRADDEDTPVYYVSCVSSFLGNISNLSPVSSSFTLAPLFCVFSYCLEWKLLHRTFARTGKVS